MSHNRPALCSAFAAGHIGSPAPPPRQCGPGAESPLWLDHGAPSRRAALPNSGRARGPAGRFQRQPCICGRLLAAGRKQGQALMRCRRHPTWPSCSSGVLMHVGDTQRLTATEVHTQLVCAAHPVYMLSRAIWAAEHLHIAPTDTPGSGNAAADTLAHGVCLCCHQSPLLTSLLLVLCRCSSSSMGTPWKAVWKWCRECAWVARQQQWQR